MCRLFSDQLDRTTLWDKIGSTLASARAKTPPGDLERFVSECLDGIKASEGAAARDPGFGQLLDTFGVWPEEMRVQFLDYIHSRRFVVVSLGRARWEEYKELNKASRPGGSA